MQPISTRVWISLMCLIVLLAVVGWGAPVESPEVNPWSETGKDAAKVGVPTIAAALAFAKWMANYASKFKEQYDADQASKEVHFLRLEGAVNAILITLGGLTEKIHAQDERAEAHDQMDRDNHEHVQQEMREIRERLYR